MRIYAILTLLISTIVFVACNSAEQKYVNELQSFTKYVDCNSDSFTEYQCEITLERYEEFRQQREKFDYVFTPDQKAQIDSCYRLLNVIIVKSFIEINASKVESSITEFKNLLEDIIK